MDFSRIPADFGFHPDDSFEYPPPGKFSILYFEGNIARCKYIDTEAELVEFIRKLMKSGEYGGGVYYQEKDEEIGTTNLGTVCPNKNGLIRVEKYEGKRGLETVRR